MESLPVRRHSRPTLPCPTAGVVADEGDLPVLPSRGDLCCSPISRSVSQMSVFNVQIPHRSRGVSAALWAVQVEIVE